MVRQYDFDILRYPLDVGNYDKGHYMVIHINKQKNSQFTGVGQKLNDPTQTALSKIDPKKSISNFKEKFSSGINKVIDNGVASISRSTNGALSWLQPSGPSFNANEAAQSTNNKEYIDSVKSISYKPMASLDKCVVKIFLYLFLKTSKHSSKLSY